MRTRCRLLALSCLALLSSSTVLAQSIHRCEIGGKTIFTDKPCLAQPSNGMRVPEREASRYPTPELRATQTTGDYASLYGEWRGQAQFQATKQTQLQPEAHSVVPMMLVIDPHGKLTGASSGNGCRVLGVASPGIGPTILNLDVTLSGCAYSGFNRRFTGRLALYTRDKYADLLLQSFDIRAGTSSSFDVKATVRR